MVLPYLLEGAKEDSKKGRMCIAMIKGLGLKYKPDSENPENSVPSEGDLIDKLCG